MPRADNSASKTFLCCILLYMLIISMKFHENLAKTVEKVRVIKTWKEGPTEQPINRVINLSNEF